MANNDRNLVWHSQEITKTARARLNNQRAGVLWFTGLSASGKSTLASSLEERLFQQAFRCYVLDGDNLRHGLNRDLGFNDSDRVENIRRAAEVSRLMVDAGLIVIAAFISPFRADRDVARKLFERGEFVEVYLDTPIEVCEGRDPKGLYQKARRGEIRNFTGIDSAYEPPEEAELVLDTVSMSVGECVDVLYGYLLSMNYLNPMSPMCELK